MPANIYLFKVNNRKARKRCEIYSKLIIKTTERSVSSASFVDFEQVNVSLDESNAKLGINEVVTKYRGKVKRFCQMLC